MEELTMRKNKRKPTQKKRTVSSPAASRPAENSTSTISEHKAEDEVSPVSASPESAKPVQNEETKAEDAASVAALTEVKPAETQLKETKPEPTHLVESKPQETKLSSVKPAETKITAVKPEETKLTEQKPSSTVLTKVAEEKMEESAPKAESKTTGKEATEPSVKPAEKKTSRKTASKSTKAADTTAKEEAPAKKTAAKKTRSTTKATETSTTAKKTTRSKTTKATKSAASTEETKSKTTRKRPAAPAPVIDEDAEFMDRFNRHLDEFKWLYMELYNDNRMFDELNYNLHEIYRGRKASLKEMDRIREKDPQWYRRGDQMGMLMDAGLFAGGLQGVVQHLDYLTDLHITHLHLTPLFKTPVHNSDDGFTVSDFRSVREDLGSIGDLEQLADQCHQKGLTLAVDFTINHTSAEHEWAQRAMQGDSEYIARYINHWDLNYRNPVVFHEMVYNLLYLANLGIDVFQLHDLNLLDTHSHSFPHVHSLVRMIRMICEMVCPGVLLECTSGMTPQEAQSFLGTPEKPECHVLYNTLVTSSVWNSLATRDTRLLKGELDNLPQGGTYVNALRTYDPLRWEMSDDPLSWLGFDPYLHREFLFSFFDGSFSKSFAKGAQYHNYEDDGSCGTTASFCGIEKAQEDKNERELELAVDRDIMLHTFLLTLPGIPTIYSGDEIGLLNQKVAPSADPRLTYRAPFQWEVAQQRTEDSTVAGKLFQSLRSHKDIRTKYASLFTESVPFATVETGDISTCAMIRQTEQEGLTAVFNFCEEERTVPVEEGNYTDLLTGKKHKGGEITLAPYQAMWLYQKK